MKIDVPVYDESGNLKFTSVISMEEAQILLQFAINVKLAMASNMGVAINVPIAQDHPRELDD